jgi:glycosyltransferase involved in cell wall biosynthesis
VPHSELSIILPCYNPPVDWVTHVADGLIDFAARHPTCIYTVIIVNDGSSQPVDSDIDRLRQLLPHPILYHPLATNRGKGYAIRAGLQLATGDYIIYTDIDFPYTVASFEGIYAALVAGTQVAVGIRDQDYQDNIPTSRAYITRWAKRVFNWAFSLRVRDTQAGLKGLHISARKLLLDTTINRYLFDLEFLSSASTDPQIIITEVAVKLRPDVIMPQLPIRILLRESYNLFRLFILRW